MLLLLVVRERAQAWRAKVDGFISGDSNSCKEAEIAQGLCS